MRFLLYTRRGCHLCEAAEDLLAVMGVDVLTVDVDADAVARERFGFRVPVLEAGGRTVMEGPFDAARLARVLSEAKIEAAPRERVDETGG